MDDNKKITPAVVDAAIASLEKMRSPAMRAHVAKHPELDPMKYEIPSREEMDAAAKRFIDSGLHVNKTIQEQSMDWALEMSRKVNAEKEQAIVQALITAMIAAGSDILRIEPKHAIAAQDYRLHRHTDPATGDWVMELKRKGA